MHIMNILIANEARKSLYRLIDEVSKSHEPTLIKGKRNAAVLISAEDWEDITETLMVANDKDLSDSLLRGKEISFDKCSTSLD